MKKKNKVIGLGLIALIIGVAGIAFYYFNNLHLIKPNFDINLLGELEKIMYVNEKPQVTTITDMEKEKTNNPDFLKDGKDGFKILQFASGAILYDPYQNKIVNISANGALFREKIKPIKVALRYNDNESGQVKETVLQFKSEVSKNFPQITFVETSTSKATYTEDVIYLVNKDRKADAVRLAGYIGNSPLLENLEPDESTTNADIIIAFRYQDNIE